MTTEITAFHTSEFNFLPTIDQRRVKSALWARIAEEDIPTSGTLENATVVKYVADSRISKWWNQDGFREWLSNRNEFQDRLEYLSHKILDSLEYIIDDPKANANAKVSAAKLIMEAARKMPIKGQADIKMLDGKIAEMDKKQLQDFIEKQLRLVSSK